MGSFKNPVGNSPPDPYEKYRAEEIQREKHLKEERKKREENEAKGIFYLAAYLLSLFKKALRMFDRPPEKTLPTSVKQTLQAHLLELLQDLERLQKEDVSQDIAYLTHLSETWHRLLQDALPLSKNAGPEKQLHSLLRSIQEYPHRQEHTLGYYLLEYAGQKWIPFPYLELLQKIYTEHQKNPLQSMLFFWTQQIRDLLKVLDS